jgi:mRNA interferase RelE/StbE
VSFQILVDPKLFDGVPLERKEQIKSAMLSQLSNPYPDEIGDKKKLKGIRLRAVYRLRVGDYRVFYHFDERKRIVYVSEILTSEQAHKKYGRC